MFHKNFQERRVVTFKVGTPHKKYKSDLSQKQSIVNPVILLLKSFADAELLFL
jgi:hypothetical protein